MLPVAVAQVSLEVTVGPGSPALQYEPRKSGNNTASTLSAKAEFPQSYSAQATDCLVRNCFFRPTVLTLVFPGFEEFDLGPTFLGKVKVDLARGDINQAVAVIQRQIIMRFAQKFLLHLFIVDFHPSRGSDIN
jgi:hypothetical protein